ncbi:MAG TPA: SDR family NAD(P)-dependent oxidoreductase, partial [Rhodanobacter sp.]
MTQRTALVTGGTGGIGSAIIRYLASQGHRVATNYRDQAKAEAWHDAMAKDGINVCMVQGDVCDPTACDAMIRAIEEKCGPIDILVNNAG